MYSLWDVAIMDEAPFMMPFIKIGRALMSLNDISHTAMNAEGVCYVYFKSSSEYVKLANKDHTDEFFRLIEKAEKAGIIVLFQEGSV